MKYLTILAAAVACLTPFAAHSSSSSSTKSSRGRKAIGTFSLVATGRGNAVFLSNNKSYKPVDDVAAQIIGGWNLSDTVRVLKKKSHRFILADLSNGETATVKLYPRVKKVIGTFNLIAKGENEKVLLQNNIFYQPSGDINEEKVSDWNLGDSIEVVKGKRKHYLLVNMNAGEFVVTKIVSIESLSSSSSGGHHSHSH